MSDKDLEFEIFKDSLLSKESQSELEKFLLSKIKIFLKIQTLSYLCKSGMIFDWTEDFSKQVRNTALRDNITLKKHQLLTDINISHADEEDYSSLILYAVRDSCENTFEYLKQQNPSKMIQIFLENQYVSRVVSLHTYLDLCIEKNKNNRLAEKIVNQVNILKWFSSQGFSFEPSFVEFEKKGMAIYNKDYNKIPPAQILELRESLLSLYLKNQVKNTPSQPLNKPQFNRF